jgi:hypothetical protein
MILHDKESCRCLCAFFRALPSSLKAEVATNTITALNATLCYCGCLSGACGILRNATDYKKICAVNQSLTVFSFRLTIIM